MQDVIPLTLSVIQHGQYIAVSLKSPCMKKLYTIIVLSSLFLQSNAQHVEWKDVAPIVYRECTSCHREGEIGEDYIDATGYSAFINSPYFYSIPYYVNTKLMPPWKADPNYHHFLDERILTNDEILLLDSFVAQVGNGNYNPGDTMEAPPPPVYAEGSQLGTPDTVLKMAIPFSVPPNNQDLYYCFVLHTNLTQDRNVKALEFRPGNAKVVHHVFIYTCEDGSADSMDATTPEYGYPSFGGAGEGVNVNFISLYGPGMQTRFYPEGSGIKLKAGTDIVIQIHYAPTTIPQDDQSYVNVFYEDNPEIRSVKGKRVGENYITEPVFFILKDKVLTFHSEFELDTTYSMFAIGPHQHLLGKSFKIWAVTPDQDSIPLCYIPQWDFRWQLLYFYNNFIILPKGTMIETEATYDNTSNNPNNPNNPPKNVGYGESSFDEMYKYFMNLIIYQPGDEDVVFDTSWHPVGVPAVDGLVSTPQLYAPIPNPATSNTVFNYYLPVHGDVTLYVYDLSGRLMMPVMSEPSSTSGFHRKTINVSDFLPGTYFFTMEANGSRVSKSFIVAH